MTAQISDKILFKGEEYSLIGTEGDNLFSPEQYGMQPEMIHTACYRGFYATYEVIEDGLYMRELTLRESQGKYLPIEGISPLTKGYEATYHNLKLLVQFSGVLRLAKDFIKDRYEHMGFQQETSFKGVCDLTFIEGRLVKEINLSDEMAEMRDIQAEVKAFTERFWINSHHTRKLKGYSGFTRRGVQEAFSMDIYNSDPDALRKTLADIKEAMKKPAWFLANISDYYETKHSLGESIKSIVYLGLPENEADFLKGLVSPSCKEKDIVAIFLYSLASLAGENWTEMTRWVIQRGYEITPANNEIEAWIIQRINAFKQQ